MDKNSLEKYSSAITMSDMEIFVFPELMYSLVLANIMSPNLWKWREDDTFKKLDGKGPYKKFMRMKQYIMDNYDFNLDLETWGLTHRDTELERFKDVISPENIASSNALFGYHGDEYYFDVDIRKHFGLDKYNTEIIPYWKTETIEAMDAFRYKQGYSTGAGECVSLAALYAAASFVVCGIPLEDIYMILTPLHSQNYIDLNGGIITNNRRIVNKTMWFNGTEISAKAQRALRNEKITIVAHPTGFVHTFYDDATIDPQAYDKFSAELKSFLTAELDLLNLVNFLRTYSHYQTNFQFCRQLHGTVKFVKAEVMFNYEHGSKFRIADDTYDKLIDDVEGEDFSTYKYADRICCEHLRQFLNKEKIDLKKSEDCIKLANYLKPYIENSEKFVEDISEFLTVVPQLPSLKKNFAKTLPIEISTETTRQEIIDYLQSIRGRNAVADLAFYAYRDMDSCDWQPFIKAALERNPVSIELLKDKPIDEIYGWLSSIENESIYDVNRLAQPDEVANYTRGDGIEKAFLLANVIKHRTPDAKLQLNIDNDSAVLVADKAYSFKSKKTIRKKINL
jgi:hypothetical protein